MSLLFYYDFTSIADDDALGGPKEASALQVVDGLAILGV